MRSDVSIKLNQYYIIFRHLAKEGFVSDKQLKWDWRIDSSERSAAGDTRRTWNNEAGRGLWRFRRRKDKKTDEQKMERWEETGERWEECKSVEKRLEAVHVKNLSAPGHKLHVWQWLVVKSVCLCASNSTVNKCIDRNKIWSTRHFDIWVAVLRTNTRTTQITHRLF